MENLKFNVGDNVKIVSNDLQPAMVGKIGRIKKVYPSFSEDSDNNVQPSYFYRVEVGGAVLKGVATNNDLIAWIIIAFQLLLPIKWWYYISKFIGCSNILYLHIALSVIGIAMPIIFIIKNRICNEKISSDD